MKMKERMLGLLAMAVMFDNPISSAERKSHVTAKNVSKVPAEKPIPKGCKRYYYNKEGICCQGEAEIHFDVLKPSNARKKYERWLKL